ncbi:hypothetical protein E0W80_04480 [Microbacterium sp. PI-1]|uniref:hypothetical protein n=1 Tax=Microbacterium sp. PI-1 TaxID=2545631 RepID=UPI00103F7B44|nr:hypothetical protein [Microbacterium sp. PI-1]TCJ28761.1 hypothetical protein E0W80_04480 [Microbacterium sp. PI-1]
MAVKGMRIKLNRDAVRKLLSSQETADNLTPRGERIATAAGEGFEATTTRNRDRVVVFVTSRTTEAKRAEAEDRALTRAIDAGR